MLSLPGMPARRRRRPARRCGSIRYCSGCRQSNQSRFPPPWRSPLRLPTRRNASRSSRSMPRSLNPGRLPCLPRLRGRNLRLPPQLRPKRLLRPAWRRHLPPRRAIHRLRGKRKGQPSNRCRPCRQRRSNRPRRKPPSPRPSRVLRPHPPQVRRFREWNPCGSTRCCSACLPSSPIRRWPGVSPCPRRHRRRVLSPAACGLRQAKWRFPRLLLPFRRKRGRLPLPSAPNPLRPQQVPAPKCRRWGPCSSIRRS